MSDEVIAISNVVSMPAVREPLQSKGAVELLALLNKLHGDVERFAQLFDGEPYAVLYESETIVKQDPESYKRWKAAIRQNHLVRLRLLQSLALNRLERDKADKPSDDLNFGKVVLGDLFEGQKIAMKKRAPGTDLAEVLDDDDEQDEADAAAAMNA